MESTTDSAPEGTPHGDEPVWTFRGYRMRPAEFNTAMVHFYRAEIQRANTWRNRLDTTTNWAIVSTGAAISFSLSDPSHHHGVLLLNIALTVIFLFVEARRYRYFELWSHRTRLMETEFFAAMLIPPYQPSPGWAGALASSLLQPKFPISTWEAVGRRFRRNYFAIFAVLILAWLFKNYSQPLARTEAAPVAWADFVGNARIASLPGEVVIATIVLFSLALIVMGIATTALQDAPGEVLPEVNLLRDLRLTREHKRSAPAMAAGQAPSTGAPPPKKFLALIVPVHAAAVSARVRVHLARELTSLKGEAMPTLVCALSGDEVEPLKRSVAAADPEARVVVVPVIG